MTIKNRETVRDYLVGLLDAACVGDGKPAEAIYGYLVGDFEGKSPVIVVASAGTEQEKRAVTSRQKINFYFTIYTFTLYAQEGTTWGEDDVEDRVDLLEKIIRETIADNLSNDYWSFIEYDGRSNIDTVMIAGEEFRRESIPINIEAYED